MPFWMMQGMAHSPSHSRWRCLLVGRLVKRGLKKISKELSRELSNEISKELSKEIPREISKELSKEISRELSRELSNEIIGHLDSPCDDQIVTGILQVSGWIVDPTGPGAVIELTLNDRTLYNPVEKASRPDVEAAFPSSSGRRVVTAFIATFDTSQFPDGSHRFVCLVRKFGEEKVIATRTIQTRNAPRSMLSSRYLQGSGIEIGALHQPMAIPAGCKVAYVDRMNVDDLRRQYPELADEPLVDVDFIDDGEKLTTFGSSSQDFIIANHFLEHTQDPIGTIKRHMEVLKPDGVLYMAIPDKRMTFDRKRPITTLAHLYQDHLEGPAKSYMNHVREWSSLVNDLSGEQFEADVRRVVDMQYSIHFHVWTQNDLLEFLVDIRQRLSLSFDIVAVSLNGFESIVVLKKWSEVTRIDR
jgi:2-polyprenyl-3-methyl-5-hydroxy-6-metoxy-1,4-benzoquinol methylase